MLGSGGAQYLDEGRVEGEDPLAGFGPNAVAHVRRTDAFPLPRRGPEQPYWTEMDEVAAFEELVSGCTASSAAGWSR